MTDRIELRWLLVLLGVGALAGCGDADPAEDAGRADSSSLHGKVMCGYQGWFRTADDGQNLGWKHYRNQTTHKFEPGHAGIEFWPDLSEFGAHERFDTPFRHADGRVAQVFSSAVRDTVVRHFKWMKDYGIDGVFVQRFATEVTDGKGRSDRPNARSVTQVLDHCRAGANEHGRTLAVMYDLTSMKADRISHVKEDWRFLVKEKGLLKDPAYQHHRGRPVLALWGVGFGEGRDYGPSEVLDLIRFLKTDPECGGLTVMLGTATGWRNGERDAGPFAEWAEVYRAADIISPWTVGRYRTPQDARRYAAGRAKADKGWCDEHGKEFMPVVFPGFAWSNLKKGSGENADAFIDRLGGQFLWTQYDAAVRETGAEMVYQAMFDELDEGTHIFKSTNDPPVGDSRFLTYGDLPSDHYLWLVGEAAKRVRGEVGSTPELPARK